MKKALFACLVILALLGCASTNTKATLLRPGGPFMDPWQYLDSFPIGQVSENQLLEQIGPPDNTYQVKEKAFHTYLAGHGSAEKFIFTVEKGMVTDVTFSTPMVFPGVAYSASKRQKR